MSVIRQMKSGTQSWRLVHDAEIFPTTLTAPSSRSMTLHSVRSSVQRQRHRAGQSPTSIRPRKKRQSSVISSSPLDGRGALHRRQCSILFSSVVRVSSARPCITRTISIVWMCGSATRFSSTNRERSSRVSKQLSRKNVRRTYRHL